MITLPAKVYDAIDATSRKYGGVGAGADFRFDDGAAIPEPCCFHGLAAEAGVDEDTRITLIACGLGRLRNDETVRAINRRKKRNTHARVDFITEYCPELGIVRGE